MNVGLLPIVSKKAQFNKLYIFEKEGVVLINVDAAIFAQSGQAGFGVVARDHQGSVQAASRGAIDHVRSPEVAEALALRQALVFAKNSDF